MEQAAEAGSGQIDWRGDITMSCVSLWTLGPPVTTKTKNVIVIFREGLYFKYKHLSCRFTSGIGLLSWDVALKWLGLEWLGLGLGAGLKCLARGHNNSFPNAVKCWKRKTKDEMGFIHEWNQLFVLACLITLFDRQYRQRPLDGVSRGQLGFVLPRLASRGPNNQMWQTVPAVTTRGIFPSVTR